MKADIVLILHHQSHIWQKSGSRFIGQNGDNQYSE